MSFLEKVTAKTDEEYEKIGKAMLKELNIKLPKDGRLKMASGSKTPIGLAKTLERILSGNWNFEE